jgi:hypothetical protein
MAKDETEEGITGLPIPKKKMSPKKRYQFEKERRVERKKRNDPRVGDGFSQHRMTGSRGHGSEYENTRSVREEVLSYLLDEGFASDEKSAEAIMGAMSESWIESIVEQTARIDYVQDKFNRENARKSGSALTHISGKQNTGQALQKAKESARQMGKLEGA